MKEASSPIWFGCWFKCANLWLHGVGDLDGSFVCTNSYVLNESYKAMQLEYFLCHDPWAPENGLPCVPITLGAGKRD
jgi:hypothetical protein